MAGLPIRLCSMLLIVQLVVHGVFSEDAAGDGELMDRICGDCHNVWCLWVGLTYFDLPCYRSATRPATFFKNNEVIGGVVGQAWRTGDFEIHSADNFVRLNNITTDDAGVYRCEQAAVTPQGHSRIYSRCWCLHVSPTQQAALPCRRAHQAKLTFTAGERQHFKTTPRYVEAGQDAKFICPHNGTRYAQLEWFHNGLHMYSFHQASGTSSVSWSERGQVLTLHQLWPGDSGKVQCRLTDRRTKLQDSQTYSLKVRALEGVPYDLDVPEINVTLGSPFTMRCPLLYESVLGHNNLTIPLLSAKQPFSRPVGQFSWRRGDTRLTAGNIYNVQDTVLSIPIAGYEHSGDYSCCYDVQCAVFSLWVYGKPKQPDAPVILAGSVIMPSAGREVDSQAVSKYHLTITVSTSREKQARTLILPPGSSVNAFKTHSCPFSSSPPVQYEFRMQAENKFGLSPLSDPFLQTGPDAATETLVASVVLVRTSHCDDAQPKRITSLALLQKLKLAMLGTCDCCREVLSGKHAVTAEVDNIRAERGNVSFPYNQCPDVHRFPVIHAKVLFDAAKGTAKSFDIAGQNMSVNVSDRTETWTVAKQTLILELSTGHYSFTMASPKPLHESWLDSAQSVYLSQSSDAESSTDTSVMLMISSILIPLLFQYAFSVQVLN